ncbi:MAG: hypothetical protein WAN76_19775 [Candidatus Sulfotelmatobacter sp.]
MDGVFYRHPMYGVVVIQPGGAFRTAYAETTLALDAYLESLPDSSYTDIQGFGFEEPSEARCDPCGGTGPLFPDERTPFLHKAGCPQLAKPPR